MYDHSNYHNRFFPLFDPITEEHIGYKSRHAVHIDGDWHRGVQANVVRRIGETFEILIQKRTHLVDIAGRKYDQSLATQMLDEDALSEDRSLQRGLREELGIINYKKKKIDALKMRIVKTYEDQPEMLNRELISIFIVEVEPHLQIHATAAKVESVEWMEWSQFLQFFERNQRRFTKTANFYFSQLSMQIERATWELLNGITSLSTPDLFIIHQNTSQISTCIYQINTTVRSP